MCITCEDLEQLVIGLMLYKVNMIKGCFLTMPESKKWYCYKIYPEIPQNGANAFQADLIEVSESRLPLEYSQSLQLYGRTPPGCGECRISPPRPLTRSLEVHGLRYLRRNWKYLTISHFILIHSIKIHFEKKPFLRRFLLIMLMLILAILTVFSLLITHFFF